MSEQQVEQDLNLLIGTALGLAGDELAEHSGFVPMGLVVQADGDVRLVVVSAAAAPGDGTVGGGESDDGAEIDADALIEDLYRALAEQRGANRAAAVVCDIHLPEDGTDAIHVVAEHADGVAVAAVRPYRQGKAGLELAEPFLESAQRLIWT